MDLYDTNEIFIASMGYVKKGLCEAKIKKNEYVFVISNKKEKESVTETNLFFKNVSKYCFAVFFIASIIISFLPMEYYYDGTYTYTYGTAVQFLQLIFIVVMGIWIFVLLRNYKNIKYFCKIYWIFSKT